MLLPFDCSSNCQQSNTTKPNTTTNMTTTVNKVDNFLEAFPNKMLVTPSGLQIPPNAVHMTPGLMNLAILRGEFTIPSLIPLASPTLLNTNMLSDLNPLLLRNSGPILPGSTNTPLRKPSTKQLNGLLPLLGIL